MDAPPDSLVQPIVATTAGKVRGRLVPTRDGREVAAFLGVPYAESPVGPLRFAAPIPVRPWDGVRDALRLGPTAPQPPYRPPFDQLLHNPVIEGDDCLNVAVWTPDPGAAGLPVVVWFPGGAFRNGSNALPIYDGAAFARDGVVLVGANYRLGAPGFAVLPDAPANRGLLDQLAALRWVRENIAAFGGDPDRVTIMGESAGGMSVTDLIASPAARGLFHRAVVQSASATAVAIAEDAALLTVDLAGRLDVEPTAAGLAGVDGAELIRAQHELALELGLNPDPARWGPSVIAKGLGIMSFFPVLDETLPELPLDAIAAGAGADLPLLIGSTADEFRFFLVPTGMTAAITAEALPMATAARGWPAAAVDVYAANRPAATPGDLLTAMFTDAVFRVPSARIAEARAGAAAPTYAYEFRWGAPGSGLGACHALELPFVFDNLGVHGGSAMTGDAPPQELADRMHAAWVAFVTDGDPGWEPYRPEHRAVFAFDHPSSGVDVDPRSDEREVWQGVL
jgi:para-nitrobenzyl esterase